MENSEKVEKFNQYEKYFLWFQLLVLGVAVSLFIVFNSFIDSLGGYGKLVGNLIIFGMIASIVNIVIAIVRILKYIIVIRKEQGKKTIWRSVLAFVTSPVALIIFYILLIVVAFASCATQI